MGFFCVFFCKRQFQDNICSIHLKFNFKPIHHLIQDLSGEKAENLVYTVLRQRHLKEAIHLEDQLAREMAVARRRARAEAEQNRQREREILLQAFEQEMVDLVANSKGMSEEELQARKHDLKREQKVSYSLNSPLVF